MDFDQKRFRMEGEKNSIMNDYRFDATPSSYILSNAI